MRSPQLDIKRGAVSFVAFATAEFTGVRTMEPGSRASPFQRISKTGGCASGAVW